VQGVPRPQRRDIALLAAGLTVSTIGDSAALVAILLELRGHGVGWVSAALAADLVPFVLFASYGGRLVDRVDNRRLLVLSLVAQGAVVVPLAFVRTAWLVVALVFAVATFSTIVRPATSAMVPVLAGEEHAQSAYSWLATGNGIGWIAGSAAGGLLTSAFGVTTALLVDAATFAALAGACSLLSATRGHSGDSHDPARRLGGLSILLQDKVLWWSVIVTSIAVACAVVDNVAAPFRFLDQLHTSSGGYGYYLSLWGLGALCGSQLPRRIPAVRMSAALAVGNAVSGLGVLGIGLAPTLGLALAASTFGGVGNGIANVALSALVTSRVAEQQRGRAFASVAALIQTGVGAGTVSGAPLVAWLAAGHAMAAAGALAALISAVTVVWTLARAR
jgi:MFS family permease